MQRPRLAAAVLLLVCALSASGRAQSTNPLFEVVTQANQPIYVADAGDGRLFIVERAGYIRIFASDALQPEDPNAFLDIHSVVNVSGEGGLTSMAFDPAFASNHFVYVMYTRDSPTQDVVLQSVIARYKVMDGDPNRLDPASAKELINFDAPPGADFTNHKGGQLQFGSDSMLYIGFGDGGSQNDPGCRSQTRNVFNGKILRIDPQGTGFGVGGIGYGIPAGNPFPTGTDPNDPNDYRPEIWALGLRNPWRFSFDRESHALWIADVGQDAREEIDLQDANSGGGLNYGWNIEEGDIAGPNGGTPNANCPAYVQPHGSGNYVAPIFAYAHHGGSSITGGYVYRGSVDAWRGRYIYADFITGSIRYLRQNGQSWESVLLFQSDAFQVASFGEDSSGELYVAFLGQGWVYKLRFDQVTSSKQNTACIVKLNQGFEKLADTNGKLVSACVAKAAKGTLAGGDVEACVSDDAKLAKVGSKNLAIETKSCAEAPSFGFAGAESGNAISEVSDSNLALDVFGDDLGAAVVAKSADKDAAGCQKAVLAGMLSCQKTRRAEFVGCKKVGLKKGTILGEEGLAGCLAPDAKGKIAKVCDGTTGKLATKTIDKSCTARGVDLSAAFPGCADFPGTLAQCIDQAGACRSCLMFQQSDALPSDACDAVCP
jgi:glucose/arabinose dehydrogenase